MAHERVEIHDGQSHIEVDRAHVARAVAAALSAAAAQGASAGMTGEDLRVSVSIVDDDTIRKLNREHLGRDEPTDVIAFDYGKSLPGGAARDIEGEVIVSAERAMAEAAERGRDPVDELLLYVVHGVLHLRGFDDTSAEARDAMQECERAVCRDLNLEDPWPERGDEDSNANSRTVTAYTDGACRGNPGPGGWGIRILYPDGRVLEKGGSDEGTTNNRMELRAAIEALKVTAGEPRVLVITDSEYVRLGITRWMEGWRRRGWKTVKKEDVRNRDLWEALSDLEGPHVEWQWVEGHAGDPDNERCDRIAVAFAEGRPVVLADGKEPGRQPPNRQHSVPGSRKSRKKRSRKSGGYYLSLVGGIVGRHRTWAECEARVKGVSRARFKKCQDRSGEVEILRSWGIDPDYARFEGSDVP